MPQPPDEKYELRLSVIHKDSGERVAYCVLDLAAKDFDLTHTGFATRYLHTAAADLINQFHEFAARDGS